MPWIEHVKLQQELKRAKALSRCQTILDLDIEAKKDADQAITLGFDRTPLKDLI